MWAFAAADVSVQKFQTCLNSPRTRNAIVLDFPQLTSLGLISLPMFQVLATLSVEEEVHEQMFTMLTTLSGGPLRIRVTDNTRNAFVQSIECNLSSILYGIDLPGIHVPESWGESVVELTTEGSTYFRFGIRTVEDAQEI